VIEDLPQQVEFVSAIPPRLLAFGFLSLFGLILWVFGRKMARPGCGISGLLAGISFALILPSSHSSSQTLLMAICIGGAIGFILAWMLFRVATGLTLAVTLALAVPIADLAWRNNLPPIVPVKVDTQTMPHIAMGIQTKNVIPMAGEVKPFIEQNANIQRNSLLSWRDQLDADSLRTMGALALAGALSGLFIGLILPYFATSVESSLFGGILMLVGILNLASHYKLPFNAQMIHGPPQAVIILGLITTAGIMAQWMMWRKKADKK